MGGLAVAFLLAGDAAAAKGNLDRGFADGGKAVTALAGTEKANGVAVQADGKIVVVGGGAPDSAVWDFVIQRYNANGTSDQDFGVGGRSVISVGPRSDVAYAVTLQSDGKIVVAGYTQLANNYADCAVVRLLPNGQPDETFGTGGIFIYSPTPTTDIPLSLATQSIAGVERILVGSYIGTANVQFSVARLTPAGQLDTTFGDAGMTNVTVGSPTDILRDIAVDGSGRIVAAGSSRFDAGGGSYRDDFAAIRLLPNGALDTSFSDDGKVVTQMAGQAQARSVAIQNINGSDKIVLGGFARNGVNNDFALLRYNNDGTIDTTFAANGKAYTDFVGNEEQITELLVQSDKKIVGVGFMYAGVNRNFALARFTTAGVLDTTFGNCGRVVTDLRTNIDLAYGAAMQPDGKVIAVGETTNAGTNADFAVVRYTTGGAATATGTDFDGDGRDDVSVYRPSDGVWYVNCSCQGFRAVKFGIAGDIPQAADYDGDGRTDQAVYRAGTWYINRSSDGQMSAANFGLADDIPTVGDYDGDEKADISVWRPSTGVWYILRSSDGQFSATPFGRNGDRPVAADYDGDGKTDLAIYRGDGDWWLKNSADAGGNFAYTKFGLATDTALTGDFDGDGKADLNLYRGSEGTWYQQSSTAIKITRFGVPTDKPVPADYDGDGKTDVAVYRGGTWYMLNSSTGAFSATAFGLASDLPAVTK